MSAMQTRGKSFVGILKAAVNEWLDDNAFRLSAALSYYSIFSIAPLLVVAIAIAGWVFGQDAAQGLLNEQLQGFVGPMAAEGIASMIKSASKPSSSLVAAIVGTVTLLVGASTVFGELKAALNTIWEVRPKPGQGIMKFVRQRLLSFGMVLAIGFLLLVSLVLTTALSAFAKYLGSALPFSGALMAALGFVISFGVVTVLFAAIFRFLPDAKVEWRHVWIGAVATALLFEIGTFLLGLYLGRESTASAYGAAASAVLLLLWVYYASLILFFGAEFTQVYARAMGAAIEPSAHAERIITPQPRAEQIAAHGDPALQHEAVDPAQAWAGLPPLKENLHVALRLPAEKEKLSPEMQKVHDFVDEYPVPSLLGAVGVGLGVGMVIRKINAPAAPTPAQQVKEGSRGLALAGLAAATAFLSRLKSRTKAALEPENLREKGEWVRKKTHDAVEEVASRLE